MLLAFIMGEQAEYLTSLGSDVAITNALLQELDTMYNGQATASFIASHVQNWTTNPFIKGAYSYSTVGMGDARKVAAEPINEKLYFAGEAMNTTGHHQTVHGAVETGYREVINILTDVKNENSTPIVPVGYCTKLSSGSRIQSQRFLQFCQCKSMG